MNDDLRESAKRLAVAAGHCELSEELALDWIESIVETAEKAAAAEERDACLALCDEHDRASDSVRVANAILALRNAICERGGR